MRRVNGLLVNRALPPHGPGSCHIADLCLFYLPTKGNKNINFLWENRGCHLSTCSGLQFSAKEQGKAREMGVCADRLGSTAVAGRRVACGNGTEDILQGPSQLLRPG